MKPTTQPTYLIVALLDDTVTAIPASELKENMAVLEETDKHDRLDEKVTYWNTIYNNVKPDEVKLYHYYNEERKTHLWSIYDSLDKIKGLRHKAGYKRSPNPHPLLSSALQSEDVVKS